VKPARSKTRATPDDINILSQSQLSALNVTTPEFQTVWQIESNEGNFYLVATTRTHGGLDKLAVHCGQSGPELLFLFNTSGHFMQDTLDNTTDHGLEFDQIHMDLLPSEILQTVIKANDEYLVAGIAGSGRILDQLQTADRLTFEMMTPSHISYAGWTTDFSAGREKFFAFLKSCN
jgi:hypothetical protein